MGKTRLEAFSDGVIAILITIMVLELKVPEEGGGPIEDLRHLAPVFLSYLMSFVFVGIYWNNHHHMLHLADRVTGPILWANLHLLFWLSLVPFTTHWLGERHFTPVPTAVYGIVFFLAGVAWLILQRTIISAQGRGSRLREAVGRDVKGKLSAGMYAVAIALAFVNPGVAITIYVLVAALWLIPDRRIERSVRSLH
ncbi:MAG TPA: TMEM175 family protein [Vicinamibacterales bacterium]|nr:TMEM175 family protein [Vicinamibacterales bacterium]